ncbi:hypothetical protein GCM10009589_11050 [Arthrobacter pascens]|uniref:hypothetical protein n=2 Tax=Arthrobacter pascens TaxID=1677 RepID=UPI00196B9DC3|nr:hypothetical protein [Arthrobacter pascens]MDR6557883.1 hypothetical protein [Arthrobacter pascens]
MAHVLTGFMNLTDRLRFVFGPASVGDSAAPVVHLHDDFEHASEEDLSQFEVETDSEGHHYAIRKSDLKYLE